MALYCYPRGYISRFCDSKTQLDQSRDNALYMTNGSETVHNIMLRAVSSLEEPHYTEEVIRAALLHFGNFEAWVRDNCTATPFLSCAALSAVSLLMDCVDIGVDVEASIRTKQSFVETFPGRAIHTPDKRLLTDSILGRLVKGHRYNTDEVIRCILLHSDNSLMTLLDVIVYFFGYIENPNGFTIEALKALASNGVNAARPM